MNYKTATEQQLEDRLADLVGFEPSDMDKLACAMVKGLKADGICDANEKDTASPNYCTDWNATMPLYEKHNMHSFEVMGMWTCNDESGNIQVESERLLRAIVICLIKVLEQKQ